MANSLFGRLCGRLTPTPARGRGTTSLVIFDLDYEAGRLFLVLTNTGQEPALSVRVDFDGPLRGLGGTHDFADLPIFAGLPVLRPGKVIRLFCEAGPAIGRIGRIGVTVHWSTVDGLGQSARYEHDVAVFRDWPELIAR